MKYRGLWMRQQLAWAMPERGQTLLGPGSTEKCGSMSTPVCSPKHPRAPGTPGCSRRRKTALSTTITRKDAEELAEKAASRDALGSRMKFCGRRTPWKRGEGISSGYVPLQSHHPRSHWLLWALLPLLTLFPGGKPLHSTTCAVIL